MHATVVLNKNGLTFAEHMKNFKIKLYAIVLFLLCGIVSYAQPPSPLPDPDPALPINENTSFLLVIALLYGTYKVSKHIHNKKASI